MSQVRNLFESIPNLLVTEAFETLAEQKHVRIERIVSHGHATPEGVWLDEPRHEWVMVLQGAARLRFENHASTIDMKPGDAIEIPAHARHRVEWTTPEGPTIWLAVHFDS